MALETIASIDGTIQKYFTRAWMDMPQEDFKTPLANSALLEKATIPKNSGQYAEFRTFSHLTPETNGTDDSPKTYAENAEPSSALALSADLVQVAFEMLAGYVELGNVQLATDPIDLMRKNKTELYVLIRRIIHQLTNDRMVKPITANVLNASLSPTPLPAPLKTIYAGGVAGFGALTGSHVFTMADFKKAVSLLRNIYAPDFNGAYEAIIDEAIKDQLLEDSEFRNAVIRHEAMTKEVFGRGKIPMIWQGCRWTIQDDPYRCNLAAAGGALTTRSNTGEVHVAHVIARGCAGYVDFGGANSLVRRTLTPKFKVQDVSKTGTGPSVGFRLPYQACILNRNRGVNVAGCTKYSDSIADI